MNERAIHHRPEVLQHPPGPLPEEPLRPLPSTRVGIAGVACCPGPWVDEGGGRAAKVEDAVQLVQLVPALEERPQQEELRDEAATAVVE